MHDETKSKRTKIFAVLLILFIGFSISVVVEYVLTVLSLGMRLGLDIFYLIGGTLKDHMFLIGVWIMMFGVFKKISLQKLTYKSLLRIISHEE